MFQIKNVLSIKFHIEKSVGPYVYFPHEWNYEAPKIDMFEPL